MTLSTFFSLHYGWNSRRRPGISKVTPLAQAQSQAALVLLVVIFTPCTLSSRRARLNLDIPMRFDSLHPSLRQ
jgi:hypothetical protein